MSGSPGGGVRKERVLLSLHGLSAGVGSVPLLREVNLTLQAGELIALTGPSGCGKTTLLRSVAGLIDPLAGEVRLSGKRPESLGWPEFRRQVVLVQQQPVLLDLSVRENLERAFTYRVAKGSFPAARARELLERVGIDGGRMLQEARLLSAGEQQRICLVRGLLVEPQVLLLDEPTSALDREAETSVERLIREETARCGAGALVVTHDHRQAERWCDWVLDLRAHLAGSAVNGDGSVACDG